MISNRQYYETIEGLCYLNKVLEYGEDIGLVAPSNQEHLKGWVRIKPVTEQIRSGQYHPMLVAAWQFNKTHLRSKMSPVRDIFENGEDGLFGKMASVIDELPELLKDYYKLCIDDGYGSNVDLDKSFIRLNTPNKKKYGGGVRVERVVIDNIWDQEDSPAYGNVYEYEKQETIELANGQSFDRSISTGVAANEPAIGGIESAHRYYQQYIERIKNTTDMIHLDMHPVNEEYMPGAQVGYSEVKVKSLASEYHYRKFTGESELLPPEINSSIPADGITSTGEIKYEFYTAKDYPVLFDKTIISELAPTPATNIKTFIGGFQRDIYRATQGYSIELNDMHGKPKSTKHFGQKKNGDILPDVVSSTEYYYNDRLEDYNEGTNRFTKRTLNNNVDLIVNYQDILNGDTTKPDIRSGELGVTRQVFGDLRKVSYKSLTTGGAGQVHAFFVPPFFVVVFPTGVPRASAHESDVETGVLNKVIHRKGIVRKVVTFDGQSKSEAENLAFDPYTGRALLQRVNNIYEENQYSYEIPAYQVYNRMGPAYQNLNQTLELTLTKSSLDTMVENICTGYIGIAETNWPGMSEQFAQGDEYIVQLNMSANGAAESLSRWTYMFTVNNLHYFHLLNSDVFFEGLPDPDQFELKFNLIRSGNRNQLAAPAMSMTALQNPTLSSTSSTEPWSLTTCDSNLSGSMDLVIKNDVLDAMAYTYDETWHFMNNCLDSVSCVPYQLNDFIRGNLGIFRLADNAKFNSIRNATGISKRGVLEEFYQFNWNEPRIFDVTNESKWIRTEGVTQYYLMDIQKRKLINLTIGKVFV